MREHIHWQELKNDSVNGYGVQIIYTFTSFDAEEVKKMKKFCEEFIRECVIVDGVRAYDIDEYKAKHNVDEESDIWQTDAFKAGWKEGYGMGKQDLSKAIMKTLEVNSKKGDTT